MDKKKLIDLAKDKRFIKGIYNYCDRWCERCPHTLKCLNYFIVKEEFADPETRDLDSEAFWNRLSGILAESLELINEKAAVEGLDLNSLHLDKLEEKNHLVMGAAEGHDISRAAKAYSRMTEEWFNEAEILSVKAEKGDSGSLLVPENKYIYQNDEMEDALKVVSWYQNQIYAKLIRAISSRIEEDAKISEGSDKYARDSDGSAKVALIGIDRSISAWGIIHNHFPNPDIRHIIANLDRLRGRIEKDFPDARAFIRPGFDRIDLNG